MKFEDWLAREKEQLTDDFDSYPKRKIIFFALVVFIFLWLIFVIWRLAFIGPVSVFEENLLGVISDQKNPQLDLFFHTVTPLGSNYVIAVLFLLIAVLLFQKRRKRAATVVLLTLLGSWVGIFFLKDFFGRPRPYGCSLESGLGCDSFPSGHAASALYFYGLLLYLVLRFGQLSQEIRRGLIAGVLLLVFLISISRIWLGEHYPTDVIGGWLLGGIFLHAGILMIDFLYLRWQR